MDLVIPIKQWTIIGHLKDLQVLQDWTKESWKLITKCVWNFGQKLVGPTRQMLIGARGWSCQAQNTGCFFTLGLPENVKAWKSWIKSPTKILYLRVVPKWWVGSSKTWSYMSQSPQAANTTHMGHFPQDGWAKSVWIFFFEASLWPNGLIFLSFLNCSEEIMSVAV